MQAAPTHTVPVYLFELRNGEDTLHEGDSGVYSEAGELPGRHDAADLRPFSGESKESFVERGKTPKTPLACSDTTDRCS